VTTCSWRAHKASVYWFFLSTAKQGTALVARLVYVPCQCSAICGAQASAVLQSGIVCSAAAAAVMAAAPDADAGEPAFLCCGHPLYALAAQAHWHGLSGFSFHKFELTPPCVYGHRLVLHSAFVPAATASLVFYWPCRASSATGGWGWRKHPEIQLPRSACLVPGVFVFSPPPPLIAATYSLCRGALADSACMDPCAGHRQGHCLICPADGQLSLGARGDAIALPLHTLGPSDPGLSRISPRL